MVAQLCKYSNFASEFLRALDYHFHHKHRIEPPKKWTQEEIQDDNIKKKKKKAFDTT